MAAPIDRLQQLNLIEQEITLVVQSAAQILSELSKDKPVIRQVESHSGTFVKTLEGVENGLAKQISYLSQVSTGQSHEGSSYSAQKDFQMALHRLEHVRIRLNELERLRADHTRQRPQHIPGQAFPTPPSADS